MPTEVTLTDTDGFEQLVDSAAMARIAAAADLSTFAQVAHFRATAVPTQRKITIEPGTAYDSFVRVVLPQGVTIDLETPLAGGLWAWLVIERDYAGAGSSRLRVLRGAETPVGFSPYLDDGPTPAGFRYEPGVLTHQVVYALWMSATSTEIRYFDRRRFKNPAENLPPYRHMLHLTSNGSPVGISPNRFGAINENIRNIAQWQGRSREFFELIPSQLLSPFYRIKMLRDVRILFHFRIGTLVSVGGDQGSIKTMVVRSWDRDNDDPPSPNIVLENEVPGENGHRLWHEASGEVNVRKGDSFGLCYQTFGLANAGRISAGNAMGRSEVSPYTCYFDATVIGPHF